MLTMKTMFVSAAMMLVGLTLAGCGAAGEPDGGSETLGIDEQPITRGLLVTGNNQLSVVKLWLPSGNYCSGTKIGSRRFLTAGHCVWNVTAGQQVTISNAVNGTGGSVFNITAVHRYPTQPANLPTGHWTDIGMLDVQQTSGIPVSTNGIRAPYVGAGVGSASIVGFGCDLADPTHDGKKQTAVITTEFFGDPVSYAGYMFASGDPKPAVCSGDSGGPVLFSNNGVWEIGGVVAAGDNNTMSWFTRLGRVRNWIANPTINDFWNGSKGSLLNYLGNNCPTTGSRTNASWLTYCDLRNVPTDPQYWLLTSAGAGAFYIGNTSNGGCLYATNPTSPGPVFRGTCTTNNAAKWSFVSPVSINGFNYYHIKNVASNLCIGTSDGTPSSGNELYAKACSSGVVDEQLFAFVP
jgi:V8-like Glu-specific endopeptidase